MNNDIAIIQPFVPTYREDFFKRLQDYVNYDLYSIQDKSSKHREGLQQGNVKLIPLKLIKLGKMKWFNPLILAPYKIIVIPGEFSIISNWLILLFGKIFNKKIYVWGHGVSYAKEKPVNSLHWIMYCLSSGGIFYTPKEMRFWKMKFPQKKMTALYNTLFIEKSYYLDLIKSKNKCSVKKMFGIHQELVFISCHRFTNINRRHDLLLKVIKESDNEKVAFIIIGDGYLKPDFSEFKNVFDFNALWDVKQKSELFFVSDYYLQFGWTGLSIIEAMAYGKPVITAKRSKYVKQSVEYYYLVNNYNSIILNDISDFPQVNKKNCKLYSELSENASKTYDNLSIENMTKNMGMFLKK